MASQRHHSSHLRLHAPVTPCHYCEISPGNLTGLRKTRGGSESAKQPPPKITTPPNSRFLQPHCKTPTPWRANPCLKSTLTQGATSSPTTPPSYQPGRAPKATTLQTNNLIPKPNGARVNSSQTPTAIPRPAIPKTQRVEQLSPRATIPLHKPERQLLSASSETNYSPTDQSLFPVVPTKPPTSIAQPVP